jgi:hypothetical protein
MAPLAGAVLSLTRAVLMARLFAYFLLDSSTCVLIFLACNSAGPLHQAGTMSMCLWHPAQRPVQCQSANA